MSPYSDPLISRALATLATLAAEHAVIAPPGIDDVTLVALPADDSAIGRTARDRESILAAMSDVHRTVTPGTYGPVRQWTGRLLTWQLVITQPSAAAPTLPLTPITDPALGGHRA